MGGASFKNRLRTGTEKKRLKLKWKTQKQMEEDNIENWWEKLMKVGRGSESEIDWERE